MKKIIGIIILAIAINSCNNTEFYKEKSIYKSAEGEIELNLAFLNDTTAAFNIDTLKTCGWTFMNFKIEKAGLYATDEHKLDTIWIKMVDNELCLIQTTNKTKKTTKFQTADFKKSKIDSLFHQLEIVKGFSDKNIIFGCDYTLNEIAYFYDQSIEKVKSRLKSPSSAKFNKVFIDKHKAFNENNEYVETDTTMVSIKVEAKNGFGSFNENEYYVFFKPTDSQNDNYEIEFSESGILKSDLLGAYRKRNKTSE